MATGTATQVDDWKTVEPNDWQTVGKQAEPASKPSGFSQFTEGLAEGNPLSMREWPKPGTPIPSISETLNPMNLVHGAVDVGKRLFQGDPRAAGQVVGMAAHPLGPRGEPVPPAMVPDEGILRMRAAGPSAPSPMANVGHTIARGLSNVALPGVGGKVYDFARGVLSSGEEGPRFSEFGENLRPMRPDVPPPRQGPQVFPAAEQPLPAAKPFEPISAATTITGRTPGPITLTPQSRTPAWTNIGEPSPQAEPPVPIVPATKSITGRAPGGLGSAAQAAAETKSTPLVSTPAGTPEPAGGINLTGPEGLPSEYLESAKEGAVAQAQNRYNRVQSIADAARDQGKDLSKMGPGQRDAFARTIGSKRPLSPGTDKLLLQEWGKGAKPSRMAGGEPQFGK